MKAGIHPTYHPNAKVTCVCGNSFETGSTLENIEIELCAACHPFYTGKQKIVDTARRVEKFQTRGTKVDAKAVASKKAKTAKRAAAKKDAK